MNADIQQKILRETVTFVRETLRNESSGHDWWHTYRVWKIAAEIARREGADAFVVEIGALLHDVADWKFQGGDDTVGPRVAREWLERCGAEPDQVALVAQVVSEVSFKGAGVDTTPTTLEGMVVQDADRLDAIGAIGIARTFAYGGYRGSLIHDPEAAPQVHNSFEEYKTSRGTVINHFYEKLLLLRDRMNTETGRAMAEVRHSFMMLFLDEFFREWDGKDLPVA